MREIKFRVWDGTHMRSWDDIMNTLGFHHWLFGQRLDITLMQYTGLKDKNGTEIYEGDILQSNGWRNREVIWSDEIGGFVLGNMAEFYRAEHMEVIGNIYVNPELLVNE